MRSTTTQGAVALVTAALIAAGCGSSKPAHTSGSQATGGAMSVKSYLDAVTGINQHLQNQNSAYFHGSGGPASLRPIQAAYVSTAAKLAALRAPAAAADKQARLVAFYRAAARKLATVLHTHPFNRTRANSIAISSSEGGGKLYSELFTIPG